MYYWNGRDNAPTQGTVAKDMHAKCKDIRQPRMRRDAGMGQRKQLLGAAHGQTGEETTWREDCISIALQIKCVAPWPETNVAGFEIKQVTRNKHEPYSAEQPAPVGLCTNTKIYTRGADK